MTDNIDIILDKYRKLGVRKKIENVRLGKMRDVMKESGYYMEARLDPITCCIDSCMDRDINENTTIICDKCGLSMKFIKK